MRGGDSEGDGRVRRVDDEGREARQGLRGRGRVASEQAQCERLGVGAQEKERVAGKG